MCGIAGIYRQSGRPVDATALARMTDALVHRGPDGRGVFQDGSLGLGHRRLSIVDLSDRAGQPMADPSGRFVLTYNGELYNYRELKAELGAIGWHFRSDSDTEVALAALAQWGQSAVHRFNGMFALAFWDAAERRLTLMRDRYGIKPLYHAQIGDSFVFASEIKGIEAHPGFAFAIDRSGLAEYLAFQNFFTPRTLVAGVELLPPGSILTVGPDGTAPDLETYWECKFEDNLRSTKLSRRPHAAQ